MSADADAAFAVQSALALAGAAGVLKDRLAGGVAMAEDHVRDELFEAGVLFHFGSRPIAGVFRPEQFAQVAIHVAAEPLKMSQPVEQHAGTTSTRSVCVSDTGNPFRS